LRQGFRAVLPERNGVPRIVAQFEEHQFLQPREDVGRGYAREQPLDLARGEFFDVVIGQEIRHAFSLLMTAALQKRRAERAKSCKTLLCCASRTAMFALWAGSARAPAAGSDVPHVSDTSVIPALQ
jgi:hypothetical protein